MRFIVPVVVLAVALAALLVTPPQSTLLGLDHQRFASAAIGAAILLGSSSLACVRRGRATSRASSLQPPSGRRC